MKAAAVVNPHAAGGGAARRWREAAGALEARLGPFECRFTKFRGHGIELARDLAAQGFDPILAAGGDGTLNEVVNGVLGSGRAACVGLLPLATGGDFARTLGVRGLAQAVEVIAAGKQRRLDAMVARYVGGQRFFVNAASIGLGAEVALGRGRMGYLAAAVRRVASGCAYEVSMAVDGEPAVAYRLTTAAIANGRYQGGGMLLAPLAAPDDGLLDLTVVEEVGLATLVRHAGKLYSGAIYSHPKVRHLRGARLRAEAAGTVPFECDGEALGALPVEVEVLPGAWLMLAPCGTLSE